MEEGQWCKRPLAFFNALNYFLRLAGSRVLASCANALLVAYHSVLMDKAVKPNGDEYVDSVNWCPITALLVSNAFPKDILKF